MAEQTQHAEVTTEKKNRSAPETANELLNKVAEEEESAETANPLRQMIQMLGVFTWAGPG